jgi:type IV pilus assembly protein PilA
MKNKGFTLIEILAVIVVLAIVSVIVVPAIDRFLRNADNTAYQVQIDAIIDAVKNWEADHPSSLPANNGDEYVVYLSELKAGNYVREDLINPRTKEAFSNNLTITIINENGKHRYDVSLNN